MSVFSPAFVAYPASMLAPSTSSPHTKTPRARPSALPKPLTKVASKKVVQAAAAAAHAAEASVDAAAVVASSAKQRKRGRPSYLSKKYRQVTDSDESLLINDESAISHHLFSNITPSNILNDNIKFPTPPAQPKPSSKSSSPSAPQHPTNSKPAPVHTSIPVPSQSLRHTSSPSTSPKHPQQQKQQLQQEQKEHSLREQSKQSNSPIPVYSRFPVKWEDALSQMCGSTALALAHGFDRIKIDVRNITTYIHQQRSVQQQLDEVNEITLLARAACSILSHLVGDDASTPCTKAIEQLQQSSKIPSSLSDTKLSILRTMNEGPSSMGSSTPCDSIKPKGAVLLFNTQTDLQTCAGTLGEYLPKGIQLGVLGEVNANEFIGKIIMVVKPCNRMNNPAHIEHMELVHYSNFNVNNWVIVLNEDLISLSSSHGLSSEPKGPLFMNDYLEGFYVQPIDFSAFADFKGGVLRCFPRKWELYMSKSGNDHCRNALRLVSEIKTKPSVEKLQCEFSWRIERELDRIAKRTSDENKFIG